MASEMLYLDATFRVEHHLVLNVIHLTEGVVMARKRNKEVTSKKAASAAAKTLSNPKASKAAKSAAASALTQRPDRKK